MGGSSDRLPSGDGDGGGSLLPVPAMAARRQQTTRFETTNVNNSVVIGTTGGTVTLDCRIFMIQVRGNKETYY